MESGRRREPRQRAGNNGPGFPTTPGTRKPRVRMEQVGPPVPVWAPAANTDLLPLPSYGPGGHTASAEKKDSMSLRLTGPRAWSLGDAAGHPQGAWPLNAGCGADREGATPRETSPSRDEGVPARGLGNTLQHHRGTNQVERPRPCHTLLSSIYTCGEGT